jgi:hypothetical protein
MKSAVTTHSASFSPNGHHPPKNDFGESQATRYLSAAAYLRRTMLPDEITELGMSPRAPYPVGRAYAIRVLFGPSGALAMSAVDVGTVRKHCWAGLWQTVIRDVAAVAVLVCAGIIDPWGTLAILALIVLAIAAIGRVRFTSPLVIAAILGLALAVSADGLLTGASFTTPLICLLCCFLIFMADTLWSVRRVRRLWRDSSAAPLELAVPQAAEQAGLLSAEPDGAADESLPSRSPGPRQVYYDKDGIVGAGTPFTLLPLTVPLDKPLNPEQDVAEFAANDLLDYISEHLVTQGPRDGQRHGYAHPPRPADGDQSDRQEAHFTYGLPDLDVREVVAVPVPKSRKVLLLPVKSTSLRHPELPPAHDVAQVAGRSPSWHPERHYVQAITAGWDGQLVASVYVSTALQGHYLRVAIRPYVLGPIVSDLRAADDLRERRLATQIAVSAGLTLRQTVMVARKARHLTGKPGQPRPARPVKRGLLSVREVYAQPVADNVHQAEDADRMLRVMELKVIRVTMDYLREHNIDVGEFESHITQVVQTNTIVGVGNIITGGKMSNSSVNAGTSQGNAGPGGQESGK